MENQGSRITKLFDEIDQVIVDVKKIIRTKFKIRTYEKIIINEETYSYGDRDDNDGRCHCERSFCTCDCRYF